MIITSSTKANDNTENSPDKKQIIIQNALYIIVLIFILLASIIIFVFFAILLFVLCSYLIGVFDKNNILTGTQLAQISNLNNILFAIFVIIFVINCFIVCTTVIDKLFSKETNCHFSHLLKFLKDKTIDIELCKNKDNIQARIDIREKLRELSIKDLSELYYITNDIMDEIGVPVIKSLYKVLSFKKIIGIGITIILIVFLSLGLISSEDVKNTGDIFGFPAIILSAVISVTPKHIFVYSLVILIYSYVIVLFLYMSAVIITDLPKPSLLSDLKVNIERIMIEKEKMPSIQPKQTGDETKSTAENTSPEAR